MVKSSSTDRSLDNCDSFRCREMMYCTLEGRINDPVFKLEMVCRVWSRSSWEGATSRSSFRQRNARTESWVYSLL